MQGDSRAARVAGARAARAGVVLPAGYDGPALDVHLEDAWVWSFDPARDGRGAPDPEGAGRVLLVPWPPMMAKRLRGRGQVRVSEHRSGEVLFEGEVAFSDAKRRAVLVDDQGHQLAVDKSGRLQRNFADTDSGVKGFIVDEVNRILGDLREHAGLDAFLGYGCLLGAVRDGRMIGHDADADLVYVSRHGHPVDIIAENRAAVATMRRLGYSVVEMSAADFKIWVHLPDGRRTGVDVFGGYFFDGDGRYYQLGSVRGTLRRDDLLPPSTVDLEGRTVLAPRRPEVLLEVCYGPTWRIPDPSFRYAHPRDITRHMDGYWRGHRTGQRTWDNHYRTEPDQLAGRRPSGFARWVQAHTERHGEGHWDLVDVGAGTGADAAYFARRGRRVMAVEYSYIARDLIRGRAQRPDVDLEVRRLNLYDVRSVLRLGAELAFTGRPRHVYVRRVAEGLSPLGLGELVRFASMVTRRGGSLFLEIGDPGGVGGHPHRPASTAPELADLVVDAVSAQGWEVHVHESVRDDEAGPDGPLDGDLPNAARPVVRLVATRPSEGNTA